jgi:hypothetical protein
MLSSSGREKHLIDRWLPVLHLIHATLVDVHQCCSNPPTSPTQHTAKICPKECCFIGMSMLNMSHDAMSSVCRRSERQLTRTALCVSGACLTQLRPGNHRMYDMYEYIYIYIYRIIYIVIYIYMYV